jgi:hypothetical protein
MRWWRKLFCWPRLDLEAEALETWDKYKRDPEDYRSLDRCIKCWRKLLKKTQRNTNDTDERYQALQYLANALLAKCHSSASGRCRLEMLYEAGGLVTELCEMPRVAPDHIRDILVNLASASFKAFQESENGAADIHLLESSIDWYRKANMLDVSRETSKTERVRLCPMALQAGDSDPAHTIDLLVRYFNLSHEATALDKAIELLELGGEDHGIADVWANHGRLLLARTLCSARLDPGKDLSDAMQSSVRAIRLVPAPGPVFTHTQMTMVLASYQKLSVCRDKISLGELDGIIEKLTSILAIEEVAQNPVTLGAIANAVNLRRQQFEKEPPDSTVTQAAALCTRALKTYQDEEVRASIFQSRYQFGRNNDDLEQAMQSYVRAAAVPDVFREEGQSRKDKAGALGECLRALVEPDSPISRVSVPFVEIPESICEAIMLT